MQYLISLDQSTTSTKFTAFTSKGQLVLREIIQHQQITPSQGLLEHNPLQIIQNIHKVLQKGYEGLSKKQNFNLTQILGLGLTNQRETLVCFDLSGKPLYNAIVWCDTRCKQICDQFKQKHGQIYKQKTGLPVSTYFTLFKILWAIKNVEQVKKAYQLKQIRFGTIDSWVMYNLTGKFITDASNASRTYLCNLNGQWDEQILKISGIQRQMLPVIVDSFGQIGLIDKGCFKGVQVRSILGDQQSSAFAHELKKNQIKITYGTGCFMLANIGQTPVIHPSFVTTIIYKHKQKIQYAFQCSVECGGGTLNWALRAGFFNNYTQLNDYVDITSQSLYFYPSFGQIYSPFWKNNVKGGLIGVSLSTSKHHIISAILQSIIFRVYDNIRMKQLQNVIIIYADGGMTVNKKFMQNQSNMINKKICVRSRDTCWGVSKGVLVSKQILFEGIKQQQSCQYQPQNQNSKKMTQKYEKWNEQRLILYKWQK